MTPSHRVDTDGGMTPNVRCIQRRTLRLLFLTQIISGVGMTVGASVGALLAAELAGIGLSGVAQSARARCQE